MDKIEIIVYSLPIMFMLHDFEEIIGLKTWFDKNGEWLDEKFPMLTKHLQSLRHLSVQAFVVAVWEEYLIISIVTLTALTFQWYDAWIIIFMSYYYTYHSMDYSQKIYSDDYNIFAFNPIYHMGY